MVKVKYEKKVTQCRRTTEYVNSITAIEGLTQPYESVGFTFLIAVLSPGNYWNSHMLSFQPTFSHSFISVSPSVKAK